MGLLYLYNTVGNELLNLSFYLLADEVNTFHHHVLVKHIITKLAILLPSGESMKHTLGIGISSFYGPDRVSSLILPDGRSRASFENVTFFSLNETVESAHCVCVTLIVIYVIPFEQRFLPTNQLMV
jgi:hypothetical protein